MIKKKIKQNEDFEYIDDINEEKGGIDIQKKVKKIKDKLKQCQKEKEEYLKGWQKERADFINYRREEEKTLEHKEKALKIEIISNFLPILDNLERAEKEIPKDLKENSWVEGVISIKSQIKEVLKKEGVEEVKENKVFNPEIHEAVEIDDGEDDKILEVLQKGYTLNGSVIRPTRVKVGRKDFKKQS